MTTSGDVVDLIKSGERARLIPVVADMSREERAVSPLLATFAIVPALANSMLEEVGAPTNPRAKLRSFCQVVFKGAPNERKLRPDGLIVVDSGRKIWSSLIEAKVGNAELSAEQIESYLDLAKELGINAVITISNQFATVPTHHPVAINKQKLRTVELYHFSWLSLLTKATLLAQSKTVDDPEQAFLLRELIRFLNHSSSGVCDFTRMCGDWKEIATRIQTGTPIPRGFEPAISAASDWQQLVRFLGLELSTAIGKPVSVSLTRAHEKDPAKRLQDDVMQLSTLHTLSADFDIPNAASSVTIEADFLRRSLRFSVGLNTPEDRARPAAALTWVLRQLPALVEATDTLVRVHWTGRAADTVATLAEANTDPKAVVPEGKKELPTGFQIQRVVDLAARFKGPSTFVEDVRKELPRFYKDVVQNLSRWVPRPPKLKDTGSQSETAEGEIERDAEAIRDRLEEQSETNGIESQPR